MQCYSKHSSLNLALSVGVCCLYNLVKVVRLVHLIGTMRRYV